MGKFFQSIQPSHKTFIEKQHIFFVATAPEKDNGRINLSPKGLNSFRVLSETKVGYMDVIGSGNETSAHLLENGRVTFMFCAFEGAPNILRLYGKGFAVLPDTEGWAEYAPHFDTFPSTRQLIVADIDMVQTSCGFGIPFFDYVGERDVHFQWADKKGKDGLDEYIQDKNLLSIDGLPTNYGAKPT
jgi:Pyridoxamine 5'-phosphate oxidase